MSELQIDRIRIFTEGDETVVKIPTAELERVSKNLNKISVPTEATAPLRTTGGNKRKLNRRKTNKKKSK